MLIISGEFAPGQIKILAADGNFGSFSFEDSFDLFRGKYIGGTAVLIITGGWALEQQSDIGILDC